MRKKTKVYVLAVAILLFTFMCLSCAAPIPLMIPVAEEGATVITEGALV